MGIKKYVKPKFIDKILAEEAEVYRYALGGNSEKRFTSLQSDRVRSGL